MAATYYVDACRSQVKREVAKCPRHRVISAELGASSLNVGSAPAAFITVAINQRRTARAAHRALEGY